MPDINDDMDDLFRRAADNYPLNTRSSDWNKVHRAMQFSEGGAVKDVKSKKKYRRFLWLLLMLPFVFVMEKYGFQNHDKGNSQIKHDEIALTEQKEKPQKNIEKKNRDISEGMQPASLNKKNLASPIRNIKSDAGDDFKNETISKTKGPGDDAINGSGNDVVKESGDYANKESRDYAGKKSFSRAGEIENSQDKYSLKQDNVINKDVAAEDLNKKQKKDVIEDKGKNSQEINKDSDAPKDINIKEGGTNTTSKVEETKHENSPAVADDTLKGGDVSKIHKNINSKKDKSRSFYVGIVAGPDFSTVKLEKILKTGYTIGVITGYKFNKRWSIESGLLIDKKYYYSEGKYFNVKNIYVPSYTKLDNVDGDCHMLELPLNVKYDFKLNKKVNWFAGAGVSSYFMSKENYQYRYHSYGWQVEKSLSLKNASKIWASVLNFSLGYSRKIGSTGTLRIEPYIKIPVRGVGTGSLPITSSGIYFGFTKKLF